MKVRCVHNTGEALRVYEDRPLRKEEFGRFGVSEYSNFGIEIGRDYLVMGMTLGNGFLSFLIDEGGMIVDCPYPLFDIIDNKIPTSWFFKIFDKMDENFPYREAVWGYYELVFDSAHYEKLMDLEEEAKEIYFTRKMELENI